jgi:regulatory protein
MKFNKSAKQTIETSEDIKELALKYLDKYQPSKKDLRIYLYRKVLDTDFLHKDKEGVLKEIDKVLLNLENIGALNDAIYSELKSKNYLRRGYSLNKIRMRLAQKGIASELLKKTMQDIQKDNVDPDFYSAIRVCKRRRIGPYRPEANRDLFYKKDSGVLARAGFSFDTTKNILSLKKDELKIYEKKI